MSEINLFHRARRRSLPGLNHDGQNAVRSWVVFIVMVCPARARSSRPYRWRRSWS